jgi:GT2 family glycosyltransferase/glycosyltransferase involved in cell wall biosynthesis/SAM-dependent methyltransferase
MQQDLSHDYMVWGVIDWHFRHQRPQQLALALAETGRRVFYISPALVDDERAGFEVEALGATKHIFQTKLFAKGAPSIYADTLTHETIAQLRQSIGEVLAWADCKQIVSLVDHPFWHDIAAVLPNSRLVYDCMDHHEGFGNNSESLLQLEKRLLSEAELTIATSSWLYQAVAPHAKQSALIRNAGDYAHFSIMPESVYCDPQGRRIIGYYGAIAEWFDLDLVKALATQHPDCCVLLIGADTVNAQSGLLKLPNVIFTGEVPYSQLPYYLHGFDVCLLPFKVIPLTLATNPVKVYEYLSAGKPVVTVDLPEMAQFEGLVHAAKGEDAFLAAVRAVLNQPESAALVQKRKAFAQAQTWQHRTETLIQHAESSTSGPKVSVIVVTYNNLELTRACLSSLEEYSENTQLEIIVVDNASSDGSPAFLSEWVVEKSNHKLILNDENRGFAAANNQGLEYATGDYLALLNNDTYVTPGWIRTLVRHLERDKTIGLIGPVTNNIGNEAKIDIAYGDMDDMLLKSAAYTRKRIGRTYPLRTAAFFCVMMPRATYERVGKLDEAFGLGFFEDDDYCRRVEHLGLGIICAEDVFIHHHLSASFNKLKQEERRSLFEKNKATYEAKWGEWLPHSYRSSQPTSRWQPEAVPTRSAPKHIAGQCLVCGKPSRFSYSDVALWRVSLNCQHCRSTSRYRSLARGILRAISELTGVKAPSLASLPHRGGKRLSIYDTQPPFYHELCAYPVPDLLKKTGWIDVALSQYKPKLKLGKTISVGITNQNLECLTYTDESLDIVITSDVMEHVRLDDRAHREIYRVLKPNGVYLFTVPHVRSWEKTLTRVQVNDPDDPTRDVHLLEPEYHGDTNSDEGGGVLAYRTYGRDLETFLVGLGFTVEYDRKDDESLGIMNTELFYCRKGKPLNSLTSQNVH